MKTTIVLKTREETSQSGKVQCVEGKLVLVKSDTWRELLYHNGREKNIHFTQYYGNAMKDMGDYYVTPIIISETEEVGSGYVMHVETKEIGEAGELCLSPTKIKVDFGDGHPNYPCPVRNLRKVLALPEHFTQKQLQAIVDGDMKDGDKVLVECKVCKSWCDNCTAFDWSMCENKKSIKQPLILHKVEESWDINLREKADLVMVCKEVAMTNDTTPLREWLKENYHPPKTKQSCQE